MSDQSKKWADDPLIQQRRKLYFAHKERVETQSQEPQAQKKERIETFVADTLSYLALAPFVESDQVFKVYFEPLLAMLKVNYKNKGGSSVVTFLSEAEHLWGDETLLDSDSLMVWDHIKAFKKAIQVTCAAPLFTRPWKNRDQAGCFTMAEMLLFLKLSPGALVAIKNYLEREEN